MGFPAGFKSKNPSGFPNPLKAKMSESERVMEILRKQQKPRSFILFTCTQNSLNTCFVYTDGPRYGVFKGCAGNLLTIRLSNGKLIKTNDLWYEKHDPECVLLGTVSTYNNEQTDESYIY